MKHRIATLFLSVAFTLSGCKTTRFALSPVTTPSSQVIVQNDSPTLVSLYTNVVILKPSRTSIQSNDKEVFTIAVQNRTQNYIELIKDDIRVAYVNDMGQLESLNVYTYDELASGDAQGIESSAALEGARHSDSNRTFSGQIPSVTGDNDTVMSSGTNLPTTYDYETMQAAQSAATAMNNASSLDQSPHRGKLPDSIATNLLKMQAIPPGGDLGGAVLVELPSFSDSGYIIFTIRVGDETHRLEFRVGKDADGKQ